MDKTKLTDLVRIKTGWDKALSDKATDVVLESIRELLHFGDRLTVHGFGSFAIRMAKPRRARNISTGETVLVPARREVKFRASQDFLN